MTQSLPHQAAAEATSRPLFGAWVPGAPFDGSSASTANLDALEAALGAPLDVIHWFRGWAEAAPPPIDLLRLVASRGATPFLTWEPWDYTLPVSEQSRFALKRIAAGDYDEYIDTWAHGLAAYRAPVVLRFAHEMNGRAYPWCVEVPGNTSKDYVAAWRHVVGRFRGAGAMNVRFLWCPNVDWSGSGRPALANLYPGDEWTGLVGLDGYNGGRDLDWGGWQSFASIFNESIAALSSLSARDIWIAETASAEAGGSKPRWIAGMWDYLATHERVAALIWFNERREADWRLESTPATLAAMRSALAR